MRNHFFVWTMSNVVKVKLGEDCNSLDDFDISRYTKFNFWVNRKRGNHIYYRCSQRTRKCPAICKGKFENDFNFVTLTFVGEHNHELEESNRITKKTRKELEKLLEKNTQMKPKEIEKNLISNLSEEELHHSNSVPGRRQIDYLRSKFIHSSFPTGDHIWNSLLMHGPFDGSTKSIRFFSLIPFFIIFATENGFKRVGEPSEIHFVDSTHSTCSPTITAFIVYYEPCQRNRYFFFSYLFNFSLFYN